MLRSRFASLVLVLTLVGATPTALAQDEDTRARAREQFGLGVQRYEAQDYTAALQAFQEAYRLAPHPMVRVNMANCYENLGRPLEALAHFERFLVEATSATRQQRREVETAIRRLQGQIGELQLSIAPDGALVTIDSSETRRAPLLEPVRLAAGTHRLEVRLEGYRTQHRELQVIGGRSERIVIQLERGADEPPRVAATTTARPTPAASTTTEPRPATEPLPTEPRPATEPLPTEPQPTAAPASTGAPEETASAETEPTPELTGGGSGFEVRATPALIITGSAAAVLTVAAVVSGALALNANDEFERAVLQSNDPSLPQAERELARRNGLSAADTANTASIVTDLFIVGAITSAGLAAFFLIVEGMDGGAERPADGAARLRVAPAFARDGAGVALHGSF
jgi:hypothetical protein